MVKKIEKIYKKIGITSNRTKNITNHVLISFLYKAGSIIISFLLVPLVINYLDTEKYGIWLTLSSFIAWFAFFDIGLGNGLRNKFAEAMVNNEIKLARGYVSTAYFTIGTVCMALIIIFILFNYFIDWTKIFNTSPSLQKELSILMPIVFGFFCLQMVVQLITTIYTADQNHSIQGKVVFFTQLVSLTLIWIMTKTNEGTLLLFGSVFSMIPAILLIIFNYFAFKGKYSKFKPSFKYWKKIYLKEIMGLGINFFIIQVAATILFSTDNFIITKLFGPKEVVPYNIAFKYFSIVTMAYTIVITPFWSSFTEAYAKNDFIWIKKSVSNIQKIWLIIPIVLTIMILISNWFYTIWIGKKDYISLQLNISIALFILLTTYNMVYSLFLNGVGKLKVQLYTAIISIVINIPLSIILASYFNLGVSGVILATCISVSYSTLLKIIQYKKIINKSATGIWAK